MHISFRGEDYMLKADPKTVRWNAWIQTLYFRGFGFNFWYDPCEHWSWRRFDFRLLLWKIDINFWFRIPM